MATAIFSFETSKPIYFAASYINWFNNVRIHGTLGYLSPVQYRRKHLKKLDRLH
ncbi:IS3 family transposase [Bacillus manliponensis]